MQKRYSDLPHLDMAIKKQIKLGNIALYFQQNILDGNENIKYVLRVMDGVNYHLDKTGRIVGVSPSENYDKTELVLFAED